MKPGERREGAELVFADQLMERGDPRGELIIVEADLEEIGIDHPKGAQLAARAAKLRPKAYAAWSKALKLGERFELELGFPSRVPVMVSEQKVGDVREHEWIIGYSVQGAREDQLMQLLRHPAFARAWSLVIDDVELSYDGLSTFCSSPEVRRLERLDLAIPLGPRALAVVLSSSSFERLVRLEIGCRSSLDPDIRDLERVAGLRSLRTLHLKRDLHEEIVRCILCSPLAHRLEEVRAHVLPERLRLPDLRRLILAGSHPGRNLRALFDVDAALPKLACLDLSDAGITTAEAILLIDTERLPALRRLDISRNPIGEDTVTALRKRFGEQLIATNMREPRQKRSTKPRLRQAGKAHQSAAELPTNPRARAKPSPARRSKKIRGT
jgi:hypothetical protein